MISRALVIFLFFVNTSILLASASESSEEELFFEERYSVYFNQFSFYPSREVPENFVNPAEYSIALDAIEASMEQELFEGDIADIIPAKDLYNLSLRDQVRWFRLSSKTFRLSLDLGIELHIVQALASQLAANWSDISLIYEILRSEEIFRSQEGKNLIRSIEEAVPEIVAQYRFAIDAQNFIPPSAEEVKKIFTITPPIANYNGGAYANLPRIFLFCRQNRAYPCLFIMKDKFDKPIRVQGKLWSQPGLAKSSKDLPFNRRSGHTPQGVYKIDGVMPYANNPAAYGKFRRLIINFIAASSGEKNMKFLLPSSSHNSSWWRESTIARDLGRNLFRVHGTGRFNSDPSSSYYPFIPTSGCIAQREGRYSSVDFIDQRKMLDRWMTAIGIPVVATNEVKISGLLYVININAAEGPVTLADLDRLGIR